MHFRISGDITGLAASQLYSSREDRQDGLTSIKGNDISSSQEFVFFFSPEDRGGQKEAILRQPSIKDNSW